MAACLLSHTHYLDSLPVNTNLQQQCSMSEKTQLDGGQCSVGVLKYEPQNISKGLNQFTKVTIWLNLKCQNGILTILRGSQISFRIWRLSEIMKLYFWNIEEFLGVTDRINLVSTL